MLALAFLWLRMSNSPSQTSVSPCIYSFVDASSQPILTSFWPPCVPYLPRGHNSETVPMPCILHLFLLPIPLAPIKEVQHQSLLVEKLQQPPHSFLSSPLPPPSCGTHWGLTHPAQAQIQAYLSAAPKHLMTPHKLMVWIEPPMLSFSKFYCRYYLHKWPGHTTLTELLSLQWTLPAVVFSFLPTEVLLLNAVPLQGPSQRHCLLSLCKFTTSPAFKLLQHYF